MQEQIINPYRVDPAWLIGASSYLVDRIVPACERIRLTAKEVPGGVLSIGRGTLPLEERSRRFLNSFGRLKSTSTTPPHGNVIDLRRNSPSNWAHFLNNHVPILLVTSQALDIDPAEILAVLPAHTPRYIHAAADMLGLTILTTDNALVGDGILYDAKPWTGIRPARVEWVQTSFIRGVVQKIKKQSKSQMPDRVFLSRRKTRAPVNEGEIITMLEPLGFVTIYPEDLSPADQMLLFQKAEIIVAIHGAGLAPLLYAAPDGRLRQIVEILHAGHMTDVYRVMAQQVGVNWIGVRGRLKPEYIRPAYDFSQKFRAYSLDNFEVDLAALDLAFEMVGIR